MPDLRSASDYRWHAAKVKAVRGKRGEAQLRPVPAGGPEMVEFDLSRGGRISCQNEEGLLFFFISRMHPPIPGHPEWGWIRIAFGDNRPHPDGVVGWVYEADYDDAQSDRLVLLKRRNRHGTQG